MKNFLVAILSAFLSVVLFASICGWLAYVPKVQRDPNDYYFGFLETSFFVIMYAGPVLFLVGLPLSFFIDMLIRKTIRKSKWARYFVGLGLYSLVGTLVGGIFVTLFTPDIQNIELYRINFRLYLIYGCIAANFYFHVSLLVSKINKRYLFFR